MENKDDLDRLLEAWDSVPVSDPHLKHHVWTRIASLESRSSIGYKSLIGGLVTVLSRPLVAGAFVGCCIACGIIIAELHVSRIRQVQSQELARNYIELMELRNQVLELEESK